MKPKKQLEEEIKRLEKGCKARKQYTDGSIKFYTCGEKTKCVNCRELLIEKKATLTQTKGFEDLIKNVKNPYPEDIFPKIELSQFQTQSINDFLLSNLKISFDRLSAELMRRARENLKKELLTKIKGDENE